MQPRGGTLIADPFPKQDSAMTSSLAQADCLIVRAPDAAEIKAGATVSVILLD